MKIKLKYILTNETSINKYIKLFFQKLEEDKQFEKLIIQARKKLNLYIPVIRESEKLDIEVSKTKLLRSETNRIKQDDSLSVSVESPIKQMLEKEVDEILKKYPFLLDCA